MLRGTSSSTLNIRTTSEAKFASTEDLEIGVDVTETSSQRYLATLSNQVSDHPYEYHDIFDGDYGPHCIS